MTPWISNREANDRLIPHIYPYNPINISGKREDHNEDSHDVQKEAKSVQTRLKNSLLQRKLLVLVQIIEVTRASVIL